MKKLSYLSLCLFFCLKLSILSSQDYHCKVSNMAFHAGEELTYVVSYNWFVIWTEVGEVRFKIKESKMFSFQTLHVEAKGSTYPGWDLFFKVRDKYQTWIDPVTVKPYYFSRDVNEGGHMIKAQYLFNRKKQYALTSYESTKYELTNDTININNCTHDVLSIIYFTRCFDYSTIELNDTIPVTLLLDNEINNLYYRYAGKEKIRLRKTGTFNCLKFKAYVVEGSVFKGGEILSVWVTDDKNRIPVYIETPILVGSVKVKLTNMKNIKHPLISKTVR